MILEPVEYGFEHDFESWFLGEGVADVELQVGRMQFARKSGDALRGYDRILRSAGEQEGSIHGRRSLPASDHYLGEKPPRFTLPPFSRSFDGL